MFFGLLVYRRTLCVYVYKTNVMNEQPNSISMNVNLLAAWTVKSLHADLYNIKN